MKTENPFSQICKQEMSTFMELLELSFNQVKNGHPDIIDSEKYGDFDA